MASKPNILFISIDDLNDWVGVLGGYPGVQTPNIDRLAERGTLFSNAHAAVPMCNGSRTAIFTGLKPTTTGIYGNNQDWRQTRPDLVSIPEYFRENGYETIGSGKVFCNDISGKAIELFDQYFKPKAHVKNPNTKPFRYGPLDVPVGKTFDGQVADFASNYLQGKHDKPFFLSVGFYRPHIPLSVPKKYFDLYPLDSVKIPQVPKNDLDDVPPEGKRLAEGIGIHEKIVKMGNWQEIVQAYLASISSIDAMTGKLLDALEKSDYADNTIVVLWSDHGWHLGEKLHWKKQTLWEEATRVPLIISAPGVTNPGDVSSQAVSLLDLYPTLVELAGLPEKKDLEGESLVPLIKYPNYDRKTPAITLWEESLAVRTEDWRYIRYFDGSEELYDHKNDPRELVNLANKPEYSGVKKELAEWLPEKKNLKVGTENDDVLKGKKKGDVLIGQDGNDLMIGKGGDDQLLGMNDNDILKGNGGSDLLRASQGDDRLIGGSGNDVLKSESGNDWLSGNEDNDFLDGEGGNDTLIGGKGNDTLLGGKGGDYLAYQSPGQGVDLMINFRPSEDKIVVSAKGFGTDLSPENSLSIDQFVIGTKAADQKDRFIYDPQTGNLFFDSDGSGLTSQVQIGLIDNQPNLSHEDILVIK
jgi:arylsulfatase A-like enzyme